MARWEWFADEKHERFFFKRGPQGWIFQSPISWWPFGLGPRRHYLVSEAQKAEIARILCHQDWRVFAVTVAVAFLGVAPFPVLLPMPWNYESLHFLVALVFCCLWVQVVFNVFYWLTLRSKLVGAPRTSDRITLVEQLHAMVAVMPVGMLILCCSMSALMLGFLTYDALTSKTSIIGSLIGVVVMGLFATYSFAILRIKLKSKPPA
jgi:hypothetical protein